jgi:hypothetical protein
MQWVPMISASRAVDRELNQLLCHGVPREQKTITSAEQRDDYKRNLTMEGRGMEFAL